MRRPGVPIKLTEPHQIVMAESSIESKLFSQALFELTPFGAFCVLLQCLTFMIYNIAVNSFALEGSLTPYLPHIAIISLNVFFAFWTFSGNSLSKVLEIVKKESALHLDQQNYCLPSGPQHQFYECLHSQLLIAAKVHGGNTVLALTDTDLRRFAQPEDTRPLTQIDAPENFVTMMAWLMAQYHESTGKQLHLIHRNSLATTFYTFLEDSNEENPLTILASTEIPDMYKEQHVIFVRCYFDSWLTRIRNDRGQFFIALLSFARWMISIGFPYFLVIITGMHALGKIQRITERSYPTRCFLFFLNAMMCILGKGKINMELKGSETDSWLREVAERIRHGKAPSLPFKATLASIFVSCISMFPYVIAIAIFFTENGVKSTLSEANYIFNTEFFTLSQPSITFLIWMNMITNILQAIATSTIPCLSAFDKGLSFGNDQTKALTKEYRKLYIFSLTSYSLDSLAFAIVAFFVSQGTDKILANSYEFFNQLFEAHPNLLTISGFSVASGILVQAFYWCLKKGQEILPGILNTTSQLQILYKDRYPNGLFAAQRKKGTRPKPLTIDIADPDDLGTPLLSLEERGRSDLASFLERRDHRFDKIYTELRKEQHVGLRGRCPSP